MERENENDDDRMTNGVGEEAFADPVEAPVGFNQRIIPDTLESDDAIPQERILISIFDSYAADYSSLVEFNASEPQRLLLSRLRRLYEERRRHRAMDLLRSRHRIDIDHDLCYASNDPILAWQLEGHFLDYLMVVPKNPGFDAVVPGESNHRYNFKLRVDQPWREWPKSKGMLGFDPRGRGLLLGEYENQQAWFFWCPEDFFTEEYASCEPGHTTGSSRMSGPRYRGTLLFLAHCMQLANVGDVYMHGDAYPKNKDMDEVNAKTNLL